MPRSAGEYLKEVRGRAWAFLTKRWGPLPLVGLFVAFVGILIEGWVTDQAKDLWRGWRVLMAQPIGFFGFWLLVLIVALVLVSFVDTSPIAAVLAARLRPGRAVKPLQISSAEREAVHHMRVLWRQHGDLAAHGLHDLTGDIMEAIHPNRYWSELLRGIWGPHLAAMNAMSQTFDESAGATLIDVIDRFNVFYQAYVTAVAWVWRLSQHHDPSLADRSVADSYRRWQDVNDGFHRALFDLHERPEYRGRLTIEVHFPPGAVAMLQGRPAPPS